MNPMKKIGLLSLRIFVSCAMLCALFMTVHAAGQVTSTVIARPGGSSITGTTPVAAYADVYGNLFVITGATTSSVVEIPVNGGPIVTIASGLNTARGVAADSLGNVYVSQVGATSILKYTPGGGTPTNIGTIEGRAFLLTLDNASPANLYVTDQDGDRVEKINTSTGVQTISPITGLNGPKGVALDGAGDLFVTNFNGNSVTELTAGGVVNQLALSGLNEPYGLAFDAAGDLFVMNAGNGELLEYPVGFTTSTTPTVIVSGITTSGESVVVNGRGDLIYTNSSHVYALQAAGGNFYGTLVGSTTAATATAITYTFGTATTLSSSPTTYLSNNAATAQFATSTATADTTTCTANKAIAANGSCVLYTAVVPTQAGPITGGVNLLNSAGSVVATTLLTGVGIAPATAFGPGTQTVFASSGLSQPTGVAVDAGGNVYLTDVGNTEVKKVSGSTTTTLGFTGLSRPYGVAVDGAGSVYVSDNYNYAVYKLTSAGVQSTVPTSGLHSPKGIALDGLGNVYIADSVNARVVKVSVAGTQTVVGFTGLTSPAWVAVDFAGDVYVTDSGKLYKLNAAGVQSTVTTTGLGTPAGISAGTDGTLYVVDSSSGYIYVLTPSGTSFTLASGLTSAAGLALAANGNLFVGNAGASQVTELSRTAVTLAFPTTPVNTTSAQLTATVQNIGNATLAYSGFAVANVSGSGFVQKTPVNDATDCYPAATLMAGSLCNTDILFTPTATGTITGTATSTDNSLNVVGSQQVVNLTGTGGSTKTATTTSVVQTVPATGNPVYGQTFTVQATVSPSSGGGTPTGTVTFYLGGTQLGSPVTLANGVAPYPTSGIGAGANQTITADYSGDSNYSASSGSLVFTMAQATPVISWSPATTSVLVDNAIGSSVLDASVANPPSGTITYTATETAPAPGSPINLTSSPILTAGTYTLTATFMPSSQYTQNYTMASANVTGFVVGCHDGTATGIMSCNPSFTDNFDTGSLDLTKWNTSYTNITSLHSWLPVFAPDVFDFLPGGGLSIRADSRPTYFPDGEVGPTKSGVYQGDSRCQSSSVYFKCWTSGALTTEDHFAQTYGYFEMSAQIAPGPGAFPAFWMSPQGAQGGYLASAGSQQTVFSGNEIFEIDIMEGNTTYLDFNWFEQGDNPETKGTGKYDSQVGGVWPVDPTTNGGKYHTYGLAWTPTTLTFYMDGQLANSSAIQNISGFASFPMYLQVDADLGGPGGAGYPNANSTFPQAMKVQYVHAYQYSPASTPTTLQPVAFGPTLMVNTANYGSGVTVPTVYSQTVTPGDTVMLSSTLINNTYGSGGVTMFGVNGNMSAGPHVGFGISDYFGGHQPTTNPSWTGPAPINLANPVPANSSAPYTIAWTVPSNIQPGIYNLSPSVTFDSTNGFPSDCCNGDAAPGRLVVVPEAVQNLQQTAGTYQNVPGQPQNGSFTLVSNNPSAPTPTYPEIQMSGSNWVAGKLNTTYTSTYYTMLEFDFTATGAADEYAIGLFPSSTYSQSGLFQIGGGSVLGGYQQYNDYVVNPSNPTTVHYTIPIGTYLNAKPGDTSTLSYLAFVAASAANSANGTFNHIRVYDLPMTTNSGVPSLTEPCFTGEGVCPTP